MDIHQVILLSVIEGITEFLPISSTAHLVLASNIMGIPHGEFLSTFEISIQVGAIAAVCIVSGKKIATNKNLLFKACLGFIPTGIIGVTLYNQIKQLLSDPLIPVVTLFLGGLAIIGIERLFQQTNQRTKSLKNLSHMTYKDSLLIGMIQSVSMIPGVSRAASSIFGAMALKFDRKSAVEFSFLLAIPTMISVTVYELFSRGMTLSRSELSLIFLGIAGSFITALIAIRWLLKYVERNDFTLFGVYRIVLSIVYYLLFLR